jgi:hypothetical protein
MPNAIIIYFFLNKKSKGESRALPNNLIIGTCLNQNKENRLLMEDATLVLENFGNFKA